MKRARSRYVLLSLLVVIGGVVVLGWYLVSRGFSARDEPNAAEAYVARRMRRMGIPNTAIARHNPIGTSPEVLSEAMEHYADHCAICHGNDGKANTLIGRGLYPRPPDMTLPETQQETDGELYYVIENGIRHTGMPAFGEEPGNEDSRESWALVDFIRHLPNITVEELETMKKMNPKSPAELEKEERIRKFLEGEDPGTVQHEHHH